MPSGPKKRKSVRKKKEAEGNDQLSIEEESRSKLESIDENTTIPAVDDVLDSNKENSSLSVVEESDELVGNDHGEVLNSNKENIVFEAAGMGLSCVEDSVAVVQEDELVGNDHGEVLNSNKGNIVIEAAGNGLSCVEYSVAVVQENVGALSQNMHAYQISEQLEGLKKMVFEVLSEVDKTRTTLHELLVGLIEIQHNIVGQ